MFGIPYERFFKIILPDICNLYYHALNIVGMTEHELIKLEITIRKKMGDLQNQKVGLKDSGIGILINTLKKADEALYDKIFQEYKRMLSEGGIVK